MNKNWAVRHHFVDEAGDGTLFDKRGHVIVGTGGCSRFFMLGLLDVPDVDGLADEMDELRGNLLADPYFADVPSMQAKARKTALAFHAKDDVPEVRREVFNLLRRANLRFFAVVRDKIKVVEYVRQRNEREPDYRYNANELYDYLVRRLFKNLLHKDDEYRVCFAKRGESDRTAALRQALETAQHRFDTQWGKSSKSAIQVLPAVLPGTAGLQAVDYFLWALQRLYERGEGRYVEFLQPTFRLVHDLDDTRKAQYGVYYTQKKPLTTAAVQKRAGDIGSPSLS